MRVAPHKKISTPEENETIATESLVDEDRITPKDLNFEEISNLREFDASYVIGMLKEDLFSEARKQTLYLLFGLVADGDTHNESDGKGNGDSEEHRSDSQSEGENTDDCTDDAD